MRADLSISNHTSAVQPDHDTGTITNELQLVLRIRDPEVHHAWEVKFPKGWQSMDYWYGEGVSRRLSRAKREGLRGQTFTSVYTNQVYYVDFGAMQQQNLETEQYRAVKCQWQS